MVNLALIGSGKWGQNYLKMSKGSSDIYRIKYVCAKSQSTLDSLSSEFVKVSDYHKLFEYNDIQGVIIATPATTHFEIAKEFLLRGFSLLIEKPMVTNYKDAVALYELWERNKQKVLIGHTQLYNPAYQEVKKLITKIGSIKSLIFEGYVSPKRTDMSVIWDWGPHPVSMSLDLLKTPLIAVSCKGSISKWGSSLYDTAKIELLFEGQISANFSISWFGEQKKRQLTIEGTKGKIILDDAVLDKKLRIYNNGEIKYPQYNSDAPLTEEIKAFISAITKGQTINSDIKLGLQVAKILSICEKSASLKGDRIEVNL